MRFASLLIITLATSGLAQSPDSAWAAHIAGCYVASPAFTYSAYGQPEGRDTSWAIVELSPGGLAARPLLERHQDAMSNWRFHHDTLVLRLSDGLAGWHAALVMEYGKWRGKGTYMTDATGAPPVVRDFTLELRSCAGLPTHDIDPSLFPLLRALVRDSVNGAGRTSADRYAPTSASTAVLFRQVNIPFDTSATLLCPESRDSTGRLPPGAGGYRVSVIVKGSGDTLHVVVNKACVFQSWTRGIKRRGFFEEIDFEVTRHGKLWKARGVRLSIT